MNPEFAAELVDVMDDRAARIVETWDAWREAPHDFIAAEHFLYVMGQLVQDLRDELAAAGWKAGQSS